MKDRKKKLISFVLVMSILLTTVFTLNISINATTDSETTTPESESTETTTSPETTTISDNTTTTDNTTTNPTTTKPTTTKPTTPKPTTPKPTKPTKPTKPKRPTVKNVTGIKATGTTQNSYVISWNKVKNATGYKISYRNVNKSKKFVTYKEIKNNKVTFKKLKVSSPYYIKVKAYIKQNKTKYYGKDTTYKTATLPSNVSKLKVVRNSSNIGIRWKGSSNVSGYRIYRASATTGGKYKLFTTVVGKNKTSFTDNSVFKGKIYYYKVKAYRKYSFGKTFESKKYSNSVFSTTGLSAIKANTKSQLGRVTLTWSKNDIATGYKVFYSSSKNGKFSSLGYTTYTHFTTDRLTNGKTYYFKVIPYKSFKGNNLNALSTNTVASQKIVNTVFGQSVGNTYVEVSITQQRMWFYVNGKLEVVTDVVTGNADGKHDTPKGIHTIFIHESPSILVGDDYRTKVQYWMQFTSDGCGIHDSTWRADSEYGGETYKYNGSHGCVNTPYSKVAQIYKKATTGTKVIVY